MLWSLTNEGTVPGVLARSNRFGVPALAMGLSMLGGLADLATSVVAASTVHLVLVSVSGRAVILVWVAIAASHLSFARRWLVEGRTVEELGFEAPGCPWVAIGALVASAASCLPAAHPRDARATRRRDALVTGCRRRTRPPCRRGSRSQGSS